MPVMKSVLTPSGKFAIVYVGNGPTPWIEGELDLIRKFSMNRDYKPYNLIDELKQRELFEVKGTQETTPIPFTQTIDEYIESIHSRNGFSRERMTSSASKEFDYQIRELVTPYADGEMLNLETIASVTWGYPCS